MAITRTPMTDDDGSGTTGTIINSAWKIELYDQIDAALVASTSPPPVWSTMPYNAANFSAVGGGTWTVPAAAVMTNRYVLQGKVLHWHCYLNHFSGAMSITGTVTALRMVSPAGVTLTDWQTHTVGHAVDSSTGANIDVYAEASVQSLVFKRRDAGNWAGPPIYLVFGLTLEIL